MIELSNGCICCSMGDDLALSLHQIVNRPDRPDHLVIEASGISVMIRLKNFGDNRRDGSSFDLCRKYLSRRAAIYSAEDAAIT